MGAADRSDRRRRAGVRSAAYRYAQEERGDPRERHRAADSGLCGRKRKGAHHAAGAGDPQGKGTRGPLRPAAL